jgi:hypothetical protein
MKKIIALVLAVVLVAMIGATGVFAQENPNASAKATAEITELCVLSWSGLDDLGPPFEDFRAEKVLEQTIKTANKKDLFIDVSLQSALFTDTVVKSKNMQRDTSTAGAAVWVVVVIDDEAMAFPGVVGWNARVQQLTAVLQGEIESVTEEGEPVLGEPEEIGLFIGTLSVNSFNFIIPDVSSGMHNIKVYAAVGTYADYEQGDANAVAVIGLGSMTIEEVRMVKDEGGVPPPIELD